MGSTAKRQAIEEFIKTGDFVLDEGLEGVGDVAADGPLDVVWLADIRDRRARLRDDPAGALAEYREFYKKPDLSQEEVDGLLAAMERAVATPEEFYDDLAEALEQEGVLDGLKLVGSCVINIPRFFPTRRPSAAQRASVERLREDFKVPEVHINPNDHRFELCDPGWWRLLKAHKFDMGRWPVGLAEFMVHGGERRYVYQDRRDTRVVALMSDFGVGQYHSRAIARQFETIRYPHIFHLGDVYYGGTQAEFDANYAGVLDATMNHSVLFSLPENHELYSGGHAYQKFIRDNLASGRIVQEGSYFCVRYAGHQIIGLDVNWLKRQRFTDAGSAAWFEEVLHEGEELQLTTILLTGSAPWVYGEERVTALYADLERWHADGRIALWFWGDDHYGALFERDRKKANFVGSCIGHAGFPGDRMEGGRPCFAEVRWLETEPRFPAGYDLRSDLGNNGWVQMSLLESGGVELLYVDWLGCRRYRARYELDSDSAGRQLVLADSEAFAQRERSFP